MGFNLKVLLHVAGILLSICLLAWCLLNTTYYATMLTLTLILSLQIGALLRFVSSTNRELSRFLAAVKYADFSQSFRGSRAHSSFRELGESFDAVIERFRTERSEKETQATYLQAFVHQLPIAVFALQDDGRIALSNQAFRKFTGGTACHHLDQIRAFDATLGNFIDKLQPGRDQNLRLRRGHDNLELKISCTLLRVRGQQQKLVSILDISSELENRELEAWQNLIRVMTHEIMNSITPITSLADTAHQYITEAAQRQPDEARATLALLEDAASATTTIGKRGQGLLRFVQSYRTLSKLPAPQPHTFRVRELLQRVVELMVDQAASQHTVLGCSCKPETLELFADPELLEQALINLVRNALDAVSAVADPVIGLTAELRERGQVVIVVTDNGCGIDQATLDNIFIPFFTTKRGGNGIGMTIVRQIVTVNGGVIRVNSTPGAGTAVILAF
jgi:nitrogen fixation/metabolism regulation signal transduction histidine kinase